MKICFILIIKLKLSFRLLLMKGRKALWGRGGRGEFLARVQCFSTTSRGQAWWSPPWVPSCSYVEWPFLQSQVTSFYCILGFPPPIVQRGHSKNRVVFGWHGKPGRLLDKWELIVLNCRDSFLSLSKPEGQYWSTWFNPFLFYIYFFLGGGAANCL